VLPGGESTAMGLIGTSTTTTGSGSSSHSKNMWECLQEFRQCNNKPVWGTCAGMILLAERCVGASAVIQDGQALIGGIDITVCRNYFGSQISSFEMATPPPPPSPARYQSSSPDTTLPFPGVFIRAPAILSAAPDVEILGQVVATPCRQAAVTLRELERKIAAGENVVQLGVVDSNQNNNTTGDAPDRCKGNTTTSSSTPRYKVVVAQEGSGGGVEEKKDDAATAAATTTKIVLPGAADGTEARQVICAARKGNLLCTAFHPELTDDKRWHEYFVRMVRECKTSHKISS
jgi:pyridoxal 5'-phosphate synthase pdxT subunit